MIPFSLLLPANILVNFALRWSLQRKTLGLEMVGTEAARLAADEAESEVMGESCFGGWGGSTPRP
jgi:hypothetical protein